MKIQIMSDLHLEFHRDGGRGFVKRLNPKDIDVLVLAGDILVLKFLDQAIEVFEWFIQKYKQIIYLPGNHEFYHSSPSKVEGIIHALEKEFPALKVLWPGTVHTLKYGEQFQRFIGSTLWFPNCPQAAYLKHSMTDFEVIDDFIPWVFEENKKFFKEVVPKIEEGDVVITHHLPSMRSVADRYKTDALNIFFVSEAPEAFAKQPKLWIHGHTHSACDYMLGNTRVVCNPLGYTLEYKAFNDRFIVEV